jgi:hypothetical protein
MLALSNRLPYPRSPGENRVADRRLNQTHTSDPGPSIPTSVVVDNITSTINMNHNNNSNADIWGVTSVRNSNVPAPPQSPNVNSEHRRRRVASQKLDEKLLASPYLAGNFSIPSFFAMYTPIMLIDCAPCDMDSYGTR